MSASTRATGLRWAIYARISSDRGARLEEDGDTVSLLTQEQGCRDLIARLDPNATILENHVYREIHTGVELYSRPKLTRLREAVRRGEVDAIACYQPKRWTRDEDHAGYLRTELREHRVMLRFVIDDAGDGDAGAIMGYLHHWVGKKEHRDIVERTYRGRTALVRSGRAWVGCKAPYGLRWIFETVTKPGGRQVNVPKGWEEDPETGPIVRRLYRDALQGASLRSLAEQLTALGVPSPKGRGGWWHVTVRFLLTNPIYKGEAYALRYALNKEDEYTGQRGASEGRKKYRVVVKAPEDSVRLPDGYAPPLIDAATWDAVQRVVSDPASSHRLGRKIKGEPRVLMVGGRTRCGDCGAALSLLSKKSPALMCSRRMAADPCATKPYIRAEVIDNAARQLARAIYTNPDAIREQANMHRDQDPIAADLNIVERTLIDLDRRVQSLLSVAQKITNPEAAGLIALQLETLSDQRKRAQAERQDLIDRRAAWDSAQRHLDAFATLCERVSQRLDSFTHLEWQQAIDALGLTATVWRADPPHRFRLTTKLEGLFTSDLLRRLCPDGTIPGCKVDTTEADSLHLAPLHLVWSEADVARVATGVASH